jgi:Fuc2NAc and GlcNAc transferase
MKMNLFLLLLVALIFSSILAGLIRRYALSRNLMDVPNSRSSHSTPTPRGGGIAFIIPFILLVLILSLMGDLSRPMAWSFLGGGIWISLIGFWDDHAHIAARWRLLAHFIGAAWVLFWLGGFPPLEILGFRVDLGWFGNVLAAVYVVWLLNLYNFMDGIDCIASIETITVCLAAALLTSFLTLTQSVWLLPMILAFSVAGFLFWNIPPAKIFMGDVGSSFLGLILGVLSIQVAWEFPQMFWVWMILLGVFIVDATLTLFCRIIKGAKIYEAHRSHAYQVAARYYHSHKVVSLAVGLINLLWLFPVGYLVSKQWIDGLSGVLIAYVPLVAIFIYIGSKEQSVKIRE